MPDRTELEALRERYQHATQALHDAERDIGTAKQGLDKVDTELTECGFNPEAGLEEQLAGKEKELDGILDGVATLLGDVQSGLPQPAG